ncbi:hypothetical protein AB5I39_12990 [Sphingomonas sp. MMS24-J45]|uniref:hypothetical protein n=1 Tax=Sphingomonas sp. MMS24-J45 TaxID=3238806 RepID=UPI00384C603E
MADKINEIEAAAREHKRVRDAAEAAIAAGAKEPENWPVVPIAIGVGVGVGSAALAAALLYAGRGRKK